MSALDVRMYALIFGMPARDLGIYALSHRMSALSLEMPARDGGMYTLNPGM
jgi:hypothetical protein